MKTIESSLKMVPQRFTTLVKEIKKYSDNTFLLVLAIPQEINFEFKAGQFVLTYLTIDNKEVNRAFSITSKPSQKNTIELLIKEYDQGLVSPRLASLQKGDKLDIRGPFGMFYIKEPKETVFIAAGTGIAPLRSMLYETLEKYPEKKATLIYGFRHEQDFFFKEELEALQKSRKFTVIPTVTHPTSSWKGHTGRVTDVIPKILSQNGQAIYICGPNQMINDTLDVLIRKMNFSKEQVHIERWSNK